MKDRHTRKQNGAARSHVLCCLTLSETVRLVPVSRYSTLTLLVLFHQKELRLCLHCVRVASVARIKPLNAHRTLQINDA